MQTTLKIAFKNYIPCLLREITAEQKFPFDHLANEKKEQKMLYLLNKQTYLSPEQNADRCQIQICYSYNHA